MAQNEIVIQVKKGVPYRIQEVDEVLDGSDAHIVTSEDRKLRVTVKQIAEKKTTGISSRVVDITMCG